VIRNATLRISNLRQVGLQQADLSQIDDLSAVLVLPLGIANYSYFFPEKFFRFSDPRNSGRYWN